jgi:predicted RNA-binding Zn ribbon-like protein
MAASDHHPKAAPGELNQIRQLVNTLDLETHKDELADPAALAAWLGERGLLAPEAEPSAPGNGHAFTDNDLRRVRALRESLRKLLLANNGAPPEPAAAEALNAAAAGAELSVAFAADGHPRLTPAREGIDGAIGRLLAIVFEATADGTWERLKACRADDCEWAFYDWSKNRSGAWCDMAACGNRAKARSYRERRQHGAHVHDR